jgi:hypothetical protein
MSIAVKTVCEACRSDRDWKRAISSDACSPWFDPNLGIDVVGSPKLEVQTFGRRIAGAVEFIEDSSLVLPYGNCGVRAHTIDNGTARVAGRGVGERKE